jgi:hypothetical protein
MGVIFTGFAYRCEHVRKRSGKFIAAATISRPSHQPPAGV